MLLIFYLYIWKLFYQDIFRKILCISSSVPILNKIANNQKDFSKNPKSSKFDFNSLNNADKNFKKEVDEVKDEAQEPEKIEEDEIKKKKLNPFG